MTDVTRRAMLRAGIGLAGSVLTGASAWAARNTLPGGSVFAATPPNTITMPLWPAGQMPGGQASPGPEVISAKGSITHIAQPYLRVYKPERPIGRAVMVAAGGGYAHVEAGHESTPACQWLQSLGFTAFEIIYRLPEEGWEPAAPLMDGQRAMRLIRSLAASHHFDPEKIGLMGFSAGGHLAGLTAATPGINRYDAIDAIDRQPSTAYFAALIYPVLTMVPPFDHTHARRSLLGLHPSLAASEALSVDLLVTDAMPPVFLAQAKDDPISPVENSLRMFAAMQAHHDSVEMHLFEHGGHGWGMGKPGTETMTWPGLFEAWAKTQTFLPG